MTTYEVTMSRDGGRSFTVRVQAMSMQGARDQALAMHPGCKISSVRSV